MKRPQSLEGLTIILVCGGRDFDDEVFLFSTLDRLHKSLKIDLILHGDQRGADRLGGKWAVSRGVETKAVPADWATHGNRAGPIRNLKMLNMDPDMVVAFPGGTGTAHMVRISKQSGIPCWEPKKKGL